MISAICPFLACHYGAMDIGNDGMGVYDTLMNIGHDSAGVHYVTTNVGDDYIRVYSQFSLKVGG